MKQEIINTIDGYSKEIFEISDYIFKTPEPSYKEVKASRIIIDFLKKQGFKVQEDYLSISTAFCATYGEGHPKLCTICEYDAVSGHGHITGHNLLTAISLMASLGIKKALDRLSGSITILGCPGEYLGGAKVTMAKQGIFDEMDVVLMAHPDIETSESGTSKALTPLAISYCGNENLSFLKEEGCTPLDGMLLTFNIINTLNKAFPKGLSIEGVLSKGGVTPLLSPGEVEGKFYIRGDNSALAALGEAELRDTAAFVEKKLSLKAALSLYSPPYEELLTNITLSRLFSHNLKECGIIDIKDFKDINAGLSLGTVSHKVPCIHPYIGITEAPVPYGSEEFAAATLTSYAKDRAQKAASALALTGLDLLQNENLLCEVKSEFFDLTAK